MSLIFTKLVARSTLVGLIGFQAYQSYYDSVAPKPIDFTSLKDKKKKIVVVGSGMAGLTTAYYLSKSPLNHVTVLERNEKFYSGTSVQNACWLPVDYCYSWGNIPIYPNMLRALRDSKRNVSKIYADSLVKDQANSLITMKFGFKWLFYQPDPEKFARVELQLYGKSNELLKQMIKDEKMDALKDFGFFESQIYIMQKKNKDFKKFTHSLVEVFKKQAKHRVVEQISRSLDPERFQ
mmetsp:Transcript_18387/g.31431  ORF Transcript_18387/g.31431 Transcript_18387/m.31431 type:complete len:236 (+) Transcript_18387:1-708(+)